MSAEQFYQPRTLLQILRDGLSVYGKHWWTLTRPLVLPLVEQLVGVMLWIGLAYGTIDWLMDTYPDTSLPVYWTSFFLANVPGMVLFIDGFWRYLVWVSGLNLVVRDLVNGAYESDQLHYHVVRIQSRAVDYSLVWLFLFVLAFIPLTLALLVQFIPVPDAMHMLLVLGSAVVMLLGYVAVVTVMVFCALAFQVFAFTPDSVLLVLMRSADLVQQNKLKVVAIIGFSLLVTQIVVPNVLVMVLAWVNGVGWLGEMLGKVLAGVVLDSIGDAQTFDKYLPEVSRVWVFMAGKWPWINDPSRVGTLVTQSTLWSIINALLLPLSTVWFALLYTDTKLSLERHDVSVEEKLLKREFETSISE
ncbi:MAG: hypothetical protein KC474_00665 [Cyanobacteria bacterium HKST-UBA04]|nr:hypothetical protein [Cyanobacteria bacterium HKST-UBA04]MCA9841878.1 hypothetical protein [Cyanobacteria bacterium HKST-UBA03]